MRRAEFEKRFLREQLRRLPSVTRRVLVTARRTSPLRAREIEDEILKGGRGG